MGRLLLLLLLFQMTVQAFSTIHGSLEKSERSTNQETNDGRQVTPELTFRSADGIEIPEACKHLESCEGSSGYKDDLVAQIIEEYKQQNKKFYGDDLETAPVAQRMGADEENVELCASTQREYVPQFAQDSNNQWYRVINSAASPQQRFRVEVCTGDYDGPCSAVAMFQPGYTARCLQKYVLRHMVALDHTDQVVEKSLKVPGCCTCIGKIA